VAGLYKSSRGFETTMAKVVALGEEIEVKANDDGTISLTPYQDFSGAPKRLEEIAPMVFREVNGQQTIAFPQDHRGRRLGITSFPAMVLLPVPWHDRPTLSFAVLIGSVGILVLTMVLWPIAAATRWHFARNLELPPATRRSRILARIVCGLDLLFAILLLAMGDTSEPGDLTGRLDKWFYAAQAVGVLGAIGTVAVLYNTVRAWRDPHRWWFSRIHETAVLLACLGYIWFGLNCNLFKFNAGF
jgi:hypothetical protein